MKDVYLSVSLHHLSTCIVAKSEEIAKSDITISKVAESSLHMHDSSTCNVPRNQIDKLDI